MTNVDQAVQNFKQGFNCSQAVFSAFAPSLGLDAANALKVAASFGGGMGMMGDTCGAVTGAFMVLGLKCGHVSAQDKATKQRLYGLVKDFAKRFEARNGSIFCRKLLGFDVSTPVGLQLATERNVHTTVCPKFVKDAAEVLAEMISVGVGGPTGEHGTGGDQYQPDVATTANVQPNHTGGRVLSEAPVKKTVIRPFTEADLLPQEPLLNYCKCGGLNTDCPICCGSGIVKDGPSPMISPPAIEKVSPPATSVTAPQENHPPPGRPSSPELVTQFETAVKHLGFTRIPSGMWSKQFSANKGKGNYYIRVHAEEDRLGFFGVMVALIRPNGKSPPKGPMTLQKALSMIRWLLNYARPIDLMCF